MRESGKGREKTRARFGMGGTIEKREGRRREWKNSAPLARSLFHKNLSNLGRAAGPLLHFLSPFSKGKMKKKL